MDRSRSHLRVRILPSAAGVPGKGRSFSGEGARGAGQCATSFAINDAVAVDAGAAGIWGELDGQRRLRHVLLTHSHADHVATLPMLLENGWDPEREPVEVWGGPEVLASLHEDLFNDRLWPRLELLGRGGRPLARLRELVPERPVEIEGLRFTPVPVAHTVPTLGLLVEGPSSAVLLPSDTGPTERIWELARACSTLRAVFLEASFPDSLAELASTSGHLTPALFASELAKLGRPVTAIAVHLKPAHRAEIVAELESLGLADLRIGQSAEEYVF